MPRITKAEQERVLREERKRQEYLEHLPWSEENKNTSYYHSCEMERLKVIRLALESVVDKINHQRKHYELSAALISKEFTEQLVALTDSIYQEELTRDGGQRPTERSMIALEAKKDD
jgi:hypothetical protein